MIKKFKGVVLAGGAGTRLFPLTKVTNKHLLPVYDKPMIYRPINTLVDAGIEDIMVVIGGPHAGDFVSILKNGEDFGIKHLEYAYQEGDRAGIADALAMAEEFADGDNLAVILGDNCTDYDLKGALDRFRGGGMVFIKKVSDPERFGVPVFKQVINGKVLNLKNKNASRSNHNLVRIEEKPKEPQSSYAVTGLYIYDQFVFDHIRGIEPSRRGELEITDVNNRYLRDGHLAWSEMKAYWRDAGTFDTLFEVNEYWREKSLKDS